MSDVSYVAPPTVAKFYASDEFARCILGPLGSGKSSGCAVELLRRATLQKAGPDGRRRTKFVVVRNSYRELSDTTRRTVEDWIPANVRKWSETDATMTVRFNDVDCEILFRALDRPDDVNKLLSLEITGAWINEAREVPRAIFDMLGGRVGRFPSKRNGGPTWSGIWMDSNPPDSDHWIYTLFEEKRPPEHVIFHQPSGLSSQAENIENLPPRYYQRMMVGKTAEWINVFVHGKYGFVRDGRPVYPEYLDDLHTLVKPPEYLGGRLVLGMDFGLTPAIPVFQKTPAGQWQAIREFVSEDMGAVRFSTYVASELRREFPNATFHGWGDPAGTQRSQVDERTPYEVVHAAGLPIDPAPSNDFVRRRESVAHLLGKLTMTGLPSFVVSPECRMLRKAMNGGYAFARVQVSGDERYRDQPTKNIYSHIAEGAQYAMLGEGEDYAALTGSTDRVAPRYKVKTAVPRRHPHERHRNRSSS